MDTWKKRGLLIAGVLVIISVFAGLIRIIFIIKNKMHQEIDQQKALANKYIKLFQIVSEWIKTKASNRTISEYLEEKGYHTVAIYGMEKMGDCLLNELNWGNVTVKYAIDQNAEEIYTLIDLYKPNEDLPDVDAIISTDISAPRNIRKQLKCKKECPILSLEEIIMDM